MPADIKCTLLGGLLGFGGVFRDKGACMPKGNDRNWLRFCAAIDGFRCVFGRWPVRVRPFPDAGKRGQTGTPSFILTESRLEQVNDHSSGCQCSTRGLCCRLNCWAIGWVSPFHPIGRVSPFHPSPFHAGLISQTKPRAGEYAKRVSVWNPDGERAWEHSYSLEDKPPHATLSVPEGMDGRLWRATGGDFVIDPRIPPDFSVSRAKWFNPEK